MDQNANIFDSRLKSALAASGVERGELARYLGVSVPTVNRWLNGISTPNAYQFREITRFFGLSYDWFLEDRGGTPDVDDLAVKLGLSPEAVEALMELAGSESEEVLTAVDDAVCAVIGTINAVYDDLLRVADNAVGEMEESRK